MKFIDVSHYQGNINFTQVKAAGIEGVYIKASEGVSYTDPYLKINYQNAKAAGLKVGFYHFLRPNNPVSEAQYFLNATNGLQPDCLYIIDAEDNALRNGPISASNRIRLFADYLFSKGKSVGLYTGSYYYNHYLDNSVKNLKLWVAEYGTSKPNVSSYVGWQYSSTGHVPGISGNVDMDEFSQEIFIKQEVIEMVGPLVVYSNVVDQGSAELLADFLKCPTINGDRPYDYSHFNPIICVGAPGQIPFTSYATKTITGADRNDTAQKVLDFIKNGGK